MHLKLTLTSEDYTQFTEKIISKYQPLNNAANVRKAARIDENIQDFAQKLCGMYQKFYPVFRKTHYQHGMYLSLINSKRSNVDNFHQDGIDENHKIFREHDEVHWLHLTSTAFEALLMNFRKLIIDTSEGAGKAISMARIRDDIKHFHTSMKANSGEFMQFEENLDRHIGITAAPEMKKLWDYIDSYNIHLEDKYSVDTDDRFHIHDLEILIDSVRNFINTIYEFYNYKEPAYIADMGHQKTRHWIAAFSSFKKYSMRSVSESIEVLAQISNLPEYRKLTPAEASEAIFNKEVLEKEESLSNFKTIIKIEIEERIIALRKGI